MNAQGEPATAPPSGAEPGTTPIEIRLVPIPARLGTPDARPFEQAIEFTGIIEEEAWGNRDAWLGPASSLAEYGHSSFTHRTLLAAWRDGEVVGCGRVRYELDANDRTAFVWVATAPSVRGQGLGDRMLALVEELALDAGRSTLSSYTDHSAQTIAAASPTARRLAASVGAAVIPETDPRARFAMRHGYALAQMERVSVYERAHGENGLPALQRALAEAAQRTGEDYELLSWGDETPEGYIDSFADALGRMALDAPAADLLVEPELWNAERVREYESEAAIAGMGLLRAAALDRTTGVIAAYTELELPAEHPTLAHQSDTLVLAEHRGNGLGMLLKAANLLSLAEVAPARRRVFTWNADENEHMLRINRDLGFELLGYIGSWQKVLDTE
ncbi:GNAT family N-acetyltransferase [Microterricola pindariensis]|uniref:N-acetyltransferase domain-containing protein n=1 Tax=Microterricola pindariensis TaxID=478010 RepID=A0ABX5AT58_9MICO|nr:GNAT family N-acetyltransferase [Microterricola pindariensis]PPL14738.1 hypothetical protein GY24_15565 [Microterricola pindariensis]